MHIGDICSRSVVTCSRETRVVELAAMMRDRHVGAVVVVDSCARPRPRPLGVVTDRDLVVQVMARGADPHTLFAGDLLIAPPELAGEAETVYDAVWHMRGKGVRRLPVVDGHGGLVGIVAADDVMPVLAQAMLDVSRTFSFQIERERQRRG